MNRTFGLPVRSIRSMFTWYGESSSIRSFHTDASSPIETHTSVQRKSTPRTASSISDVRVSVAPVSVATSRAVFTSPGSGHRCSGAQIRTSIPSLLPTIISELPVLNRASPR